MAPRKEAWEGLFDLQCYAIHPYTFFRELKLISLKVKLVIQSDFSSVVLIVSTDSNNTMVNGLMMRKKGKALQLMSMAIQLKEISSEVNLMGSYFTISPMVQNVMQLIYVVKELNGLLMLQ